MSHPIPAAALDDRIGFLGTSGSGKTYNAGTAVEILLSRKARVVIVDPLGVWWGLRLLADGKKESGWGVVIFGGPHGDLPITEHAGALIGETAATMSESCIVDLSEFASKSADRRFMSAFLEALYRKAPGEPFHLVVDEADLFAPQKPSGGDETLLGHMENIVRRGRIKGFIPWLISQRPAVLNKNVLSQVDGLVAFKLTATQDRDALDGWIEGQADRAQGKAIKDELPTMPVGRGVVWIPGRGVLETASFPPKVTFDSSRTPKRGEKAKRTAAIKPLDVGALKERLQTITADAAASDPKALKAEITKLKAELAKASKAAPEPKAIEAAETRGFARGRDEGFKEGAHAQFSRIVEGVGNASMLYGDKDAVLAVLPSLNALTKILKAEEPDMTSRAAQVSRGATSSDAPRAAAPISRSAPKEAVTPAEGLTPAKQRILDAIAWMESLGAHQVPKDTLAFLADASPNSSAYANNLGALRSAGLVEYPAGGLVALTIDGRRLARAPAEALTHQAIMAKVGEKLAPAQMRILQAAADLYPDAVTRDALADLVDASPTSSAFANNLGRLRTFGLITYPDRGSIRADDKLFPE